MVMKKILLFSLLVTFDFLPSLGNALSTDPLTFCVAERDAVRSSSANFAIVDKNDESCQSSYLEASNCCDGSGKDCAVSTTSLNNNGTMSGSYQTIAQGASGNSSALTSNANICSNRFIKAQTACEPTSAEGVSSKNAVANAVTKLQDCLRGQIASLNAGSATMSAQGRNIASDDGVTKQGIQNALQSGANNPSPTTGTSQEAMNTLQKCVTVVCFAASAAAGNMAAPKELPKPDPIYQGGAVGAPPNP